MPLYEYRCESCGHELEYLQGIHEPDPVACPVCSAKGLRRKVSRVSFRLKGSGWYETDFKTEGRRHLAEDGAGATTNGQAGGAPDAKDKTSAASASSEGAGSTSPAASTPAGTTTVPSASGPS